jgi:hypothetical protein
MKAIISFAFWACLPADTIEEQKITLKCGQIITTVVILPENPGLK